MTHFNFLNERLEKITEIGYPSLDLDNAVQIARSWNLHHHRNHQEKILMVHEIDNNGNSYTFPPTCANPACDKDTTDTSAFCDEHLREANL